VFFPRLAKKRRTKRLSIVGFFGLPAEETNDK
jgi:hypothetical protein